MTQLKFITTYPASSYGGHRRGAAVCEFPTGAGRKRNAVPSGAGWQAAYTWAGTVLLTVLAWYEVRVAAVAVVWALGGLVLALIGRRLANRDLTYQANLLALSAFIGAIVFNFSATNRFHGFTERLISVILIAVLLYVTARWSWVEEIGERDFFFGSSSFPFSHVVRGAYIWAGSFLLSLLAWYELYPVSVAVAWMVGGLVLLELGLIRKSAFPSCPGLCRVDFRVRADFLGKPECSVARELAPGSIPLFRLRWPCSIPTGDCWRARRNCCTPENKV